MIDYYKVVSWTAREQVWEILEKTKRSASRADARFDMGARIIVEEALQPPRRAVTDAVEGLRRADR